MGSPMPAYRAGTWTPLPIGQGAPHRAGPYEDILVQGRAVPGSTGATITAPSRDATPCRRPVMAPAD